MRPHLPQRTSRPWSSDTKELPTPQLTSQAGTRGNTVNFDRMKRKCRYKNCQTPSTSSDLFIVQDSLLYTGAQFISNFPYNFFCYTHISVLVFESENVGSFEHLLYYIQP